MNNILKQLYNGEIYPSEQIVPTDPEYRPLELKISNERTALKKKLSKEDGERLEELGNMYLTSSTYISYANFSHGFKLGVLLMLEVFDSGNEPKV